MKPEQNLDYLAAKYAQKIVAEGVDENILTKTLGVLQENGVYACFLYLQANKKKDSGAPITSAMLALLGEEQFGLPKQENDDVLKYVSEKITTNLPTLLLAKEALEQMLIYARYGAKAAGKQ